MNIKKLILQTNALPELKAFYQNTLGFPIIASSENSFEVQMGTSTIEFQKSDVGCYYHYACNVPSFQSGEALHWLEERVAILPDENGNKIIDFVNWNADAIYFFDPAFNEPEMIARKNLDIQTDLPFSPKSIINISEIGLPVKNVEDTFQYLNQTIRAIGKYRSQNIELARFSGDFKRFGAAGNEQGLFILVDQEKKIWYPTTRPALAFPLEVFFGIGEIDFHLKYDGETVVLLEG